MPQQNVVVTLYSIFCSINVTAVLRNIVWWQTIWSSCVKIVYNVEKFFLFNILKSKLRYCSPFWNGSARKEIGPKNANVSTLIGCHGNVPWDIGKRGPDRSSALKMLSFGVKIVKIGPVDPEIIVLREIIKKRRYSPVGKCAKRAKKKFRFLAPPPEKMDRITPKQIASY